MLLLLLRIIVCLYGRQMAPASKSYCSDVFFWQLSLQTPGRRNAFLLVNSRFLFVYISL